MHSIMEHMIAAMPLHEIFAASAFFTIVVDPLSHTMQPGRPGDLFLPLFIRFPVPVPDAQ